MIWSMCSTAQIEVCNVFCSKSPILSKTFLIFILEQYITVYEYIHATLISIVNYNGK